MYRVDIEHADDCGLAHDSSNCRRQTTIGGSAVSSGNSGQGDLIVDSGCNASARLPSAMIGDTTLYF